jgi:pimeloyl-ACP methyl ester carboxylesterase
MKEAKATKNKKYSFRSTFLKLIFVLTVLPTITFAADPPVIPDGWSDGFVYDNGVRIHYYHAISQPGKQVIVMVHGVTDNGLCWTTLTWKLQNSYDIYMLDTRGHGLSDPFTPSDDGETLIKDVVGFVKAMNFNKPILIGHSMGAATVMRVGAEYPGLARAIIMLDPFITGSIGRGPGSTNNAPPKKPDNKNSDAKKLSINMFGDPEKLVAQNNYSYDDLVKLGRQQNPKWDIVDVKYWALSKKQYHGAYTQSEANAMFGTMNITGALAKITVPSLILKADTSPEGRKANEAAVKGLKLIKLVHIDGAAHNLHHDELARTVKEINEFLSTL